MKEQGTTRFRIRKLLSDGVPRTVSMLAAELELLQNTAYKVVQRMEKAGQVERDEHGYVRIASASPAWTAAPAKREPVDSLTARLEMHASGRGQALLTAAVRSSAQEKPPRMSSRSILSDHVPSGPAHERFASGMQMADSMDLLQMQKVTPAEAVFPNYVGWSGVIEPEYDLMEPYTILDTEVYFRQAIHRRLSLMFRNGVRLMSDSPAIESYIRKRISRLETAMQQTFEGLLKDILFNLLVCSNCIMIKIRSAEGQVSGYRIVPPYHLIPVMDGRGRIAKWRHYVGGGRIQQEYEASEIVHFFWDRKPGHVFGTPRTIAVRDDIVALRRIEEHMELLLNRMLFPLFHFKVGTEKAPCQITAEGISEIDLVRRIIESMPRDGMLITDERVSGDVLESGFRGIDLSPVLEHYKRRVVTGLGVSSLDLGEPDTSNRATADNVSQNLKDAVASDCAWFAGQVKQMMFRDWIEESQQGWNVARALSRISLEFPEIDVDSMIKLETHAINAYNNNAITHAELRSRMKLAPLGESGMAETHFMQHTLPLASLRMSARPDPAERTVQTLVQPENQHGRNPGPTKAKSSMEIQTADWLSREILDLAEMLDTQDLGRAAELLAVSLGLDMDSAGEFARQVRAAESDLDKIRQAVLANFSAASG